MNGTAMSKKIKIAFTSCARYESFPEQPQWSDIDNEAPDYLFLLGDQIYMDFGLPLFSKEHNGKPKHYPAAQFRKIMEEKYTRQWNEPHFKRLFEKMKQKNAVYGVWDDHDFAWNNARGSDIKQEIKDISRECFHHWMGCSTNKPEVYCHIDIPGARVIFLDNRYYASDTSLLGDAQFAFLAEKLNHPQKYTFICSGLTLTHTSESWKGYGDEYEKLCALIAQKQHIIFLSGDIHRNAFSAPTPQQNCYEIISSGLAVKYFGLPFKFDDRHNWGVIEFDANEVCVKLVSKNGSQHYRIDGNTWMHSGPQDYPLCK